MKQGWAGPVFIGFIPRGESCQLDLKSKLLCVCVAGGQGGVELPGDCLGLPSLQEAHPQDSCWTLLWPDGFWQRHFWNLEHFLIWGFLALFPWSVIFKDYRVIPQLPLKVLPFPGLWFTWPGDLNSLGAAQVSLAASSSIFSYCSLLTTYVPFYWCWRFCFQMARAEIKPQLGTPIICFPSYSRMLPFLFIFLPQTQFSKVHFFPLWASHRPEARAVTAP